MNTQFGFAADISRRDGRPDRFRFLEATSELSRKLIFPPKNLSDDILST